MIKRLNLVRVQVASMERKWIVPLAIDSTVSLLLLFLTTLSSPDSPLAFLPLSLFPSSFLSSAFYAPVFVESKLRPSPPSALPLPPRLAYLVTDSVGDGNTLKRTFLAIYHPANRYVVHLNLEAPLSERQDLHDFIARHLVFSAVSNVRMITRANLVTYRGPTMVTNTLHAAAVLLKEGGEGRATEQRGAVLSFFFKTEGF